MAPTARRPSENLRIRAAMNASAVQKYIGDFAILVPVTYSAQLGLNRAYVELADREAKERLQSFGTLGGTFDGMSRIVYRLSLDVPPKDQVLGWTIGAGLESDIPIAVSPGNCKKIANVHARLNIHPRNGLWTVGPVAENKLLCVKQGDEWRQLVGSDEQCFTHMDDIFRLGDRDDDLIFEVRYVVPESHRLDFFWQRHEYMQELSACRHSLPHKISDAYPTQS